MVKKVWLYLFQEKKDDDLKHQQQAYHLNLIDLQQVTLEMMFEKKIRIKESDVLHTLIRKYLKDVKTADVMEYREKVLGKDE